MTNAEFSRLYKQSRVKTAITSLKAQTELRSIYISAGRETADRIRYIKTRGLSQLSLSLWTGIQNDLKSVVDELNIATVDTTMNGLSSCAETYSSITTSYLSENARNEFITYEGINKVASAMNKRIVQSIVNRTFHDGYTFSQRVWNNGDYYQDVIKEIVARGVAIGRDPVKIAKDIQVYTADGKVALAKRWANIQKGTVEWSKRIPLAVDWRAVRLVRSEIQMSAQQAGVESGRFNVGSTGEYKWILGPGLAHCSSCIDNSLGIYTEETLPDYEHPNCGCTIEPVMRDLEDFGNQLAEWANGNVNSENRYIDLWYEQRYKPALAS